ncbi:hypothetical protein L484_014561 [Morus notabilis]|uniref:Uncharacterized protein n=1 Tax=Morus notabilis TaxID=981085 RepID=W9RIR6_9ROSA|nr:hypothetical protein L484_014561 [Morus notabilis]
MGGFVRDLKEEFTSVEYVYVWHAFCGYTGVGVHRVELSKGVKRMMEDQAMGNMVADGMAFVPPKLAA